MQEKHRMLLCSMTHTQLCNTPSSPAQLVTKYWGTGEDMVFNWHWKQGWAELLLRAPSAVFHTHCRGSADFDVLNAGGPSDFDFVELKFTPTAPISRVLPFTSCDCIHGQKPGFLRFRTLVSTNCWQYLVMKSQASQRRVVLKTQGFIHNSFNRTWNIKKYKTHLPRFQMSQTNPPDLGGSGGAGKNWP